MFLYLYQRALNEYFQGLKFKGGIDESFNISINSVQLPPQVILIDELVSPTNHARTCFLTFANPVSRQKKSLIF